MTPRKKKEPKLKPCPWCGGPMIILPKGTAFEFVHNEWNGKCRAYPMMLGTERDVAIKAWNTRAK